MKLTRERIEEIKASFSEEKRPHLVFYIELIHHAEATLDDGWIKVEERLPDDEISVMAFDSSKGSIFIAHRFYNEWFLCEDGAFIQVTHWRELPPPPIDNRNKPS